MLVSRANPEFAHFFFVHEHFERFLTETHRRAGEWWYFVPWFVLGILPWLLVWAGTLRAKLARRAARSRNGFSWERFCARLGRVRLRVLQHLRVQAAVVHPADVSGAGARARLRAHAAVDARTLMWIALPLAIGGAASASLPTSLPGTRRDRGAGATTRRRSRSTRVRAVGAGRARRLRRGRHRRVRAVPPRQRARRRPGASRRSSLSLARRRCSSRSSVTTRSPSCARPRLSSRDARTRERPAARSGVARLPGRHATTRRAVLPRPPDAARRFPRRDGARASTPSRARATDHARAGSRRGTPRRRATRSCRPRLPPMLATAGRADARARARPAPRVRDARPMTCVPPSPS